MKCVERYKRPHFPFYTSFRHGTMKCFTIDLLDKNMNGIKNNRLENVLVELKNMSSLQSTHLAYYLHYPGQLFRGVPLVVEYTPNQGLVQGNLSSKNFWIDSVEIVRSRNTLKSPCMTNSSNNDEYIATNLFEANPKVIKCKNSKRQDDKNIINKSHFFFFLKEKIRSVINEMAMTAKSECFELKTYLKI